MGKYFQTDLCAFVSLYNYLLSTNYIQALKLGPWAYEMTKT